MTTQLAGWIERDGCRRVKIKIGSEPARDPPQVHAARAADGVEWFEERVSTTSVVDADCRNWDIRNLWICDGSVFPTVGGVNPSLTIQAIACPPIASKRSPREKNYDGRPFATGAHVVVTGASAGVGRAIALDVSDADAVERAAARIEDELGPIDVWVNNAMVTVFAPVESMTSAEFAHVKMVQMPALNKPQFDWADNHMPHIARPVAPIFLPEAAARAGRTIEPVAAGHATASHSRTVRRRSYEDESRTVAYDASQCGAVGTWLVCRRRV